MATTGYPVAALKAGTLPGRGELLRQRQRDRIAVRHDRGRGRYLLRAGHRDQQRRHRQPDDHPDRQGGRHGAGADVHQRGRGDRRDGQGVLLHGHHGGQPDQLHHQRDPQRGLAGRVSFSNNGNGTATLTGTPTAASAGTYPVTFTAANTGGTTTQSFVLTVTGAPAITSAATATATVGSGFSFTVRATGAPAPALAEAGALPQGLTWVDNGNGTATLAGTPGVDQGGVYKLTITATNSGGTATQAFTLTVNQAPAITSAATATATHGQPYTFTFTSIGYPVASVTHTGTVPGLTYTQQR